MTSESCQSSIADLFSIEEEPSVSGPPPVIRQTGGEMAYVIAEPCIGVKDTACVEACPVDCIHPKKDELAFADAEMLYIDPLECIDCGACVPVCPVSAIFTLEDLPRKWEDFARRNREDRAGTVGKVRAILSSTSHEIQQPHNR